MNIRLQLFKQRGLATLLISIILLVAATIITLYQSRTTIMNLKITTKEYNHELANEIADAGLEQAIAYLLNNQHLIGNSVDTSGWMYGTPKWEECSDATYPCGDGVTQKYGSDTLVYRNVPNMHTSFDAPNAGLTIHYLTDNVGGFPAIFPVIKVISIASVSNDATSIIKRSVKAKELFNNVVPSPLVINGSASFGGTSNIWGNATGYNNGPLSMWTSSGALPISGNSKTYDTSVSGGTYPNTSNVLSQTTTNAGDIVENDGSFPSDLFYYTFGVAKTEASKVQAVSTMHSDCTGLNSSSNGLHWVTGDCKLTAANGDIGTSSAPIILIVAGDTKITSNLDIYGMMYFLEGSGSLSITGTVDIHGSIISEKDFSLASGTANIHYDSSVIAQANQTGGTFSYLLGTWDDSQ